MKRTGTKAYIFSQLGNIIIDELLYYFSFKDVRELVDEYKGKNLNKEKTFKQFRKKLFDIEWDPRKTHAFLRHWLTYTTDGPGEEDMDIDVALKDRTVDCEEHRTVANALLVSNGYSGDAVNMYYIPADPEGEAAGHATKIISYKPTVVTLGNWGLINHHESGMGFIRDFIPNANYYDKLEGRWEGNNFVHEYTEEGEVEETWETVLFKTIHRNLPEFIVSPKRFDTRSLIGADADYMKKFINRRNYLIEMLEALGPTHADYGNVLRQIKIRNQLLRRPDYNLDKIKARP